MAPVFVEEGFQKGLNYLSGPPHEQLGAGWALVDLMREEVERPERLIDINGLPLRDIRQGGDTLVIGALARMADTRDGSQAMRSVSK